MYFSQFLRTRAEDLKSAVFVTVSPTECLKRPCKTKMCQVTKGHSFSNIKRFPSDLWELQSGSPLKKKKILYGS